MAIADDISVAVNGDIRYTGTTANYSILELHRLLQGLADDEKAVITSQDYLDIVYSNPSTRILDQYVVLNGTYNIDDTLSQHLYGGTISQDGGNTLYSGLKVRGSVNSSATQIQIIQAHALYDGDTPFWGTQVTPYNGGGDILMRILVKSRWNGFDIDGKRIRVRAGHMHSSGGDSFDSFDVELGITEKEAFIHTLNDQYNTTAVATIGGWTGGDIPTNTEGYQYIDIGDGSGEQPYYSKWTFNTNTGKMKALWEWAKYITRVGSSNTLYGMEGDLFRGVTHEIDYDGQTTNLQDNEFVVWGTHIWYDALTGGTFTRGNYVKFSGGNAGTIMYDDGVNDFYIALDDTSITIADNEDITEYSASTGAATGVTADVDTGTGGGSPIVDNDKDGGEGWIIVMDDVGTAGQIYLQLTRGKIAVDNMGLVGITSGGNGDILGTVEVKAIPAVFIGQYLGTLRGSYGVGFDPDDLVAGDTVEDLDDYVMNAPSNATFSLYGLVSGEDRVLIMKKHASNDDFNFTEMALDFVLNGVAETSVWIGHANGDNTSIPLDAPQSGVLRITLDDGRHKRVPYTAYDPVFDEFTIPATDFSGSESAAVGNGVSFAFIDKVATNSIESFTLPYNADRTLWMRVTDGGTAGDATPIKVWESQGNFSSIGGNASVKRESDA